MFQFSGFPPYDYVFIIRWQWFALPGFPIRTPAAQWICAPPRSFSQLIASFFGSWCQGIRPAPFVTWSLIATIARCLMVLILYSLAYEHKIVWFKESFVCKFCLDILVQVIITCAWILINMQFSRYVFEAYAPSGDKGIRTLDPLLARQVLSQLSYTPRSMASTYVPTPLPA